MIRPCSKGMDTGQIYNWYKTWSKEAPYDFEQHVAFNEALGDSLPAKFMVMPPQAPPEYEEYVWTDVLFMRTLNMNQARRRVEARLPSSARYCGAADCAYAILAM